MPKTKSSRQIAIRREAARRTVNGDAKLTEDVEWLITHWNTQITTKNRATICRDFRNVE